MTSGTSTVMALLTFVLISTTAVAAAPDILAGLERSGPDAIRFVELRYSKMLKKPVRAEGTLRYTADGQLEREVVAPRPELTRISADTVRIERAGSKPRTVSLDRAPELRVLLNSFSALLTGDTAALTRDFEVNAEETGGAWRVLLEPHDEKLRDRVPRLTIEGASEQLRCFTLLDSRGGATLMVLGAAAENMPASSERTEIERHCQSS